MKLSVFVITYNQERFIRKALDSILMQKVNFEYEVVVGEDCSTDKTPEICDEYAKKFPFIKVYHHASNIGLVKNWEFVLNHCSGDYIAMLEGDDYWVDEYKLQRQVDFLDSHKDVVLTFTNADVEYMDGVVEDDKLSPKCGKGYKTQEDILGNWIALTSSVVMRNVLGKFKYPSNLYISDTYTFLSVMKYGKAYMLDDVSVVYRRHKKNITAKKDFDSEVDEFILWARQYRMMQKHFKNLKKNLLERELIALKCVINTPPTRNIKDFCYCRLRWVWLHKELFFSSFMTTTLLSYTPLRYRKILYKKESKCSNGEPAN